MFNIDIRWFEMKSDLDICKVDSDFWVLHGRYFCYTQNYSYKWLCEAMQKANNYKEFKSITNKTDSHVRNSIDKYCSKMTLWLNKSRENKIKYESFTPKRFDEIKKFITESLLEFYNHIYH